MTGGGRTSGHSHVAVFDNDLPTGLAFVRSLGRAGVATTVYSSRRSAPGRLSRFARDVRWCPEVTSIDEFTAWMIPQIQSGSLGNVAPTSDCLAYNLAKAVSHCHGDVGYRGPSLQALTDCLFKDRFARAMATAGFPVPPSATPLDCSAARAAAHELGYPVVLKPRSHVGLDSGRRGSVVRDDAELRRAFVPFPIDDGRTSMLQQEPLLAFPLLQKYLPPGGVDIVSLSGCLDQNGELLASSHARKLTQTPPQLGVGTLFEALPSQPFTQCAVAAVRQVLQTGVFELEVVVDRVTGDHWAIDLNPRAFGQISLDVARGNDLPLLWYRSVTGIDVRLRPPPKRAVQLWRQAVPFYTAAAVRLVRGPDRRTHARHLLRLLGRPSVDAAFEWSDPVPGLAHAYNYLRHPGGLVRPFLAEPTDGDLSAGLPEDRSPESVTLGLTADVGGRQL